MRVVAPGVRAARPGAPGTLLDARVVSTGAIVAQRDRRRAWSRHEGSFAAALPARRTKKAASSGDRSMDGWRACRGSDPGVQSRRRPASGQAGLRATRSRPPRIEAEGEILAGAGLERVGGEIGRASCRERV